jgi:hypothetical protein
LIVPCRFPTKISAARRLQVGESLEQTAPSSSSYELTSTSTAGTVCQCSAAAALYVGRFLLVAAAPFLVVAVPFFLPLWSLRERECV